MTTLTIEIPDKVEKTLSDLVKLLGGKVIVMDSNSKDKGESNQDEKSPSNEREFIKEFKEAKNFKNLGSQVFIEKRRTYDYSILINGRVLGPDTYRGFHKIDKSKPGAKEAFESILIKNKDRIIGELGKIKNEKELDDFENEICKELKSLLKKNILNSQLYSFNKLRKPIDIIIEHFIAMGSDFANSKNTITPFLFLPLDSQMFRSDIVFTDNEIKDLNIKRSYTFKDIADKQQYYDIQEYLKTKAQKLGFENRIYFDLVWGDRYKKKSSEIF